MSCSWVSNQQETTEGNFTTPVPSTQPYAANANHEETVPVRDGPIAFSEAAIQVDTDLFVCPTLKATKRRESEDYDDDGRAIKKGSKCKSIPQSTNN